MFIRGKRRKNRKRHGLRTLSVKGSGVEFTHGEGISTPRVRHKGRLPLIKCANMTSICFIFPFTFLCTFMLFCIFYLFVVDKGVSVAPTYSSIATRKSDLRSSFIRTEHWISCFYLFSQDIFWCGRQGCFPRSYVSSITMRKSDLRSSFRTKCWLCCFDLFPQDRF